MAVARTQDIDKYGIDTFLQPFVNDLKSLFVDGITVTTGSSEQTHYGALLAFLTDTAAAHKLAGFKESMSFAHRICRSCMATRVTSQSQFNEDQFELRTPQKHEQQCQSISGSNRHENSVKYGINRTSVLEEIPGFSVATGIPHDVMHDLFEGVVHYELMLFLQYCVSSKFFSVATLNNRIRGYDFGTADKPAVIDATSLDLPEKKFRQSAGQIITLVRNIPLLIADKIPDGDETWTSFLLLIRICQIALSPIHSQDTGPYLRILVEEKLSLLHKLYPTSTIKPKMHYMVHYASQIERHGPLIHSWTMRHEGKLCFMKRSSRRGNFKNIVKTVVKHHQLWLSYHLNCVENLLYSKTQLSSNEKQSNLMAEPEHIKSQIVAAADLTPGEEYILYHYKWLKVHSTHYKLGDFVLLERDDFSPQFGKISDIIRLEKRNNIFFLVEPYSADFFASHYNAYVITP